MKKEEELIRKISEMTKETKTGKLKWKIQCSTTEYNDPSTKPVMEEDKTTWTVDECYVSYYCEYKGEEFLMITYEMIHKADENEKTTNLVFLPPLGIRFFDLHALLPYAIENTQLLTYHVHQLWLTILEKRKEDENLIHFVVDERKLTIED